MDKHLSWSPHVSKITGKASRTLNFLKRNLSNCSTQSESSSIFSSGKTTTGICFSSMGPCDVHKLENIQRRAARWVLKDYSRYSLVTSMLQHLSWPELKTRRKISRLQTFYKALHNQIPLFISIQLSSNDQRNQAISSVPFHTPYNIYYSLPKKVFLQNSSRLELVATIPN